MWKGSHGNWREKQPENDGEGGFGVNFLLGNRKNEEKLHSCWPDFEWFLCREDQKCGFFFCLKMPCWIFGNGTFPVWRDPCWRHTNLRVLCWSPSHFSYEIPCRKKEMKQLPFFSWMAIPEKGKKNGNGGNPSVIPCLIPAGS